MDDDGLARDRFGTRAGLDVVFLEFGHIGTYLAGG
jgi:hypothetical protein